MNKDAPHLPNKACRVDTYYRLQNIKWILLFAVFAFVAGGTSAVMVSSWLMPSFEQVDFTVQDINNQNIWNARPDSLLKKQFEQRLLTIYDRRKQVEDNIYREDAVVAQATIISSDGWAVISLPDFISGEQKYWEILDYQNVSYDLENLIYDKLAQVYYLKIEANGLRVVSFANPKDFGINSTVWSLNKDKWSQVVVKDFTARSSAVSRYIYQPSFSWKFSEEIIPGDILLDNNGNLVGLMDENNLVAFSWLIENQVSSLLESGKLVYKNVPWNGYFVKTFDENNKVVSGFYINKIYTIQSKNSEIKVGDIVLKIDGEVVDEKNLSRQMWLVGDEFKVLVWRDGEEIDLTVNKENVPIN